MSKTVSRIVDDGALALQILPGRPREVRAALVVVSVKLAFDRPDAVDLVVDGANAIAVESRDQDAAGIDFDFTGLSRGILIEHSLRPGGARALEHTQVANSSHRDALFHRQTRR